MTVQVRCIRAHGTAVPGDVAEVPDGASVDPEHWEPVTVGESARRPTDAEAGLITAEQKALSSDQGLDYTPPQAPPETAGTPAPAAFPPASAVTPKGSNP